jgi:hypothetical protein
MSHPPVTSERRVLYTGFSLAARDDALGEDSMELRKVREAAYKNVSQPPSPVVRVHLARVWPAHRGERAPLHLVHRVSRQDAVGGVSVHRRRTGIESGRRREMPRLPVRTAERPPASPTYPPAGGRRVVAGTRPWWRRAPMTRSRRIGGAVSRASVGAVQLLAVENVWRISAPARPSPRPPAPDLVPAVVHRRSV